MSGCAPRTSDTTVEQGLYSRLAYLSTWLSSVRKPAANPDASTSGRLTSFRTSPTTRSACSFYTGDR